MQVITVFKPVEPVKPPVEKFIVELMPEEAAFLRQAIGTATGELPKLGYAWAPEQLGRLERLLDVALKQK